MFELVKLLPKTVFEWGNLSITYYALFILCGALIAFFITRHEAKIKGADPGAIDGLFAVSLTMGIIGARIWYVIAQWNSEFKGEPFVEVFKIWNGGLAIQGGAILGMLTGIIYVKLFIKELHPIEALDQVVPTVLLAQAIGRIGNFFNIEVYGKCVSVDKYNIFPDWFKNQLIYKNESGALICSEGPTYMAEPLFMWEGLINILGFIVMFVILYKLLKKFIPTGFISGLYFVWYGATRIIMEPMRNQEFIMGNLASRKMAFGFVIFGFVVIIISIIVRCCLHKNVKANKTLQKELQVDDESQNEERPLLRSEVGITKYITPEKYQAHDFTGLEDSKVLTEEDVEKAKDLVKEDDEVVDDFIVIKTDKPQEEDDFLKDEQEEKPQYFKWVDDVKEEEEENPEPRVVEIEEGDVPSLSKINKFVEKNKDVEEDLLEGYRTQYNPDIQKDVVEDENLNVEVTINEEEASKTEVPTAENGEPLIEYKNGFGSSKYSETKEEIKEDVTGKNVVEIEEGDVPELSKINKFVEKNKDVEDSILEGYRNPYNPEVEKEVEEIQNEEVSSTVEVEVEEKVPVIGEMTLEFKQCPAPERTGGVSIEDDNIQNEEEIKDEYDVSSLQDDSDSSLEEEVPSQNDEEFAEEKAPEENDVLIEEPKEEISLEERKEEFEEEAAPNEIKVEEPKKKAPAKKKTSTKKADEGTKKTTKKSTSTKKEEGTKKKTSSKKVEGEEKKTPKKTTKKEKPTPKVIVKKKEKAE